MTGNSSIIPRCTLRCPMLTIDHSQNSNPSLQIKPPTCCDVVAIRYRYPCGDFPEARLPHFDDPIRPHQWKDYLRQLKRSNENHGEILCYCCRAGKNYKYSSDNCMCGRSMRKEERRYIHRSRRPDRTFRIKTFSAPRLSE